VEIGKATRIYDQLVESKDDFLGILAYSVYKRQKNEIISRFKDQEESGLEIELKRFYDLCNSDTQLSYFRTEAEQLAQNFAQAALQEQLDDYERQYDSRLKDEMRSVKPSFWMGVWSSVIGSFIFVLVLGILVFFSWSLKQGPKQAIESIFNIKISSTESPQMPSPSPSITPPAQN
jgi:ATP-dependent Zn protease